jgi:hypothetical protein
MLLYLKAFHRREATHSLDALCVVEASATTANHLSTKQKEWVNKK